MEKNTKESPELTWQKIVKMSKESLVKYLKGETVTQYLAQIEIVFSFLKGLYNESVKQTKELTFIKEELQKMNRK